MNHHLLLFNYFAEDNDKYKENNLSRALAISLKNDSVLMNIFLKEILTENEFKDLFYTIGDTIPIEIDVQKRVSEIEETGILKAIALTPVNLPLTNQSASQVSDDPITDIYIRIKDLSIIIEVKKYPENCETQLLGQAGKLVSERKVDNDAVTLVSLSWGKVIEMFLATQQYLASLQKKSVFVDDFIKYFEQRFPSWFPVKTLNRLPFTLDKNNPTYNHIYRRLELIKVQTGFGPLKEFQGRTAIPVDFSWASEVNIWIKKNPANSDPCITVGIWPGDTKQQGYSLFSKPLEWTKLTSLRFENENFDLNVTPYLKFSHFTKGIAWITLSNSLKAYALKSHTDSSFDKLAGRWKKDRWKAFEKIMDKLFQFDWRNQDDMQWDEKFINSNRQYFDLALGFLVSVYLPYSKAQELEQIESYEDPPMLSQLIKGVVGEIQKMIEMK